MIANPHHACSFKVIAQVCSSMLQCHYLTITSLPLNIYVPFLPLHGSSRKMPLWRVKVVMRSPSKALLVGGVLIIPHISTNFSHYTQSWAQSNACNASFSVSYNIRKATTKALVQRIYILAVRWCHEKFYSWNLIYLQTFLSVEPQTFNPQNLISVQY